MKRSIACLAILLPFSLYGQGTPRFDIVDIHASPKTQNPNMRGGVMRGGRYELHTATMVDLIRTAYGVEPDKVVGGPSWLETDRFEVIAKGPSDATPETLKIMLQALLADRFHLVVHKDSRPLPAYALTVGKKPLLKEADGTGEQGCRMNNTQGTAARFAVGGPPPPPPPGGGRGAAPPPIQFVSFGCRSETMPAFAEGLRTMGAASILLAGNPVVDQTGLKGAWDFDLKITPFRILQGPDTESITIFDAVDKQLGLKLTLTKVPTPVIAVDTVDRKPTDNPPGITQALPPPAPPEFEVADIKPSDPSAPPRGFGIQPGGRMNLQGMTLQTMIMQAWTLRAKEALTGAPKWLDTDRFDIIAKAPTMPNSNLQGQPGGAVIDLDQMWLMLRALLVDRFKLATHFEEQPVPVYALIAVKPKLTKADPANRSSCKTPNLITALSAPGANGTPTLTLTCQNTTMAELADRIQNASLNDVTHPVVDATGLEGGWDFTISWSPAVLGQIANANRAASAPTPGEGVGTNASDPNGGINMMQAIEKLGLKLDLQKRPMPVLVIDHVEQKPTEN